MKIAVVTPVFQGNHIWLEQCLASVRSQTVPCTHLLINDGNIPLPQQELPGIEYYQLPKCHNNEGLTATAIGAISVAAQDYDAVAFLGAAHWFAADHLQKLLELQERTKAHICTSSRNLVDLNGQLLGKCYEVDGQNYVDTNAFLLTRPAFGLLSLWQRVPKSLTAISDRVIWNSLMIAKVSRAHSPEPTLNFRTLFAAHYTYFHRPPPPGALHVQVTTDAKGNYLSAEVLPHNAPERKATAARPSSQTPTPSKSLPGRPRVSLCMIVKNEEANLSDCLGPIADLFYEMIVVDTGSSDGTKECARRSGAKVYDFVWTDSFADARNESVRHATGDWIFWLDGDERLDEANLQKLRRLLAELPNENNAYLMSQLSAPDRSTGTSLVVDQTRLFRKLPNVKWSYRVHEQILVPLKENGAREFRTEIVIHHLGYQDAEMRQRKRERNTRLLQLDLKENPKDAFIHFNLANAFMDASKMEEALDLLKRCKELAPPGASYLPKVYFMLAGGYHLLGRDDESLQVCRAGKRLFPNAVDIWFQEGILLLAKDDLNGARNCFEMILALPKQGHYVGMDPELPKARTFHNLAFVYRRLGLKQKAEEQWLLTIENSPSFEPAWLALSELYIEQHRQIEAEGLLQRLDGNPARSTIEPALLARLTVAKRDIVGARRILEDALARNPKTIWLRVLFADILLRVAKDPQAAESQLREILAIAPNEQQTRKKLAMLLANKSK